MSNKVRKIKTVENIEHGDCRWPVGDPRDAGFHFCGAQQTLGRPYCSHHWSISVEAVKARQPLKAPLYIKRAA